jgi:enamine deaminase RidA (YjgF/YER057c/UK114 family)
MKMRAVRSPKVPDPQPQTWSNCKVCGDQVFISGMVARDAGGQVAGDMYAQSARIFEKIRDLMQAAGGAMDDVVKVTIFVTDIRRREEVWRARREFFTGDFPCSTLVEVRALASPEILVEIEAVGFLGAGGQRPPGGILTK